MAEKDDILAEAREAFDLAVEAEKDNREEALDDVRFARLAEQWPLPIKQLRGTDRPMLTINKMPAFIRQVVNDARQNKPSIKVHPADDKADPETAEVMNGLIRNIEYTSNADVAYDTATEHAVGQGWGYFKIELDYAHDDTFDMDIGIERVSNPFSIYGDPYSTAADSSDWNSAFEVEWLTHDDFEAQFGKKDKVNWEDYCDGIDHREQWVNGQNVLIAKRWKREEITRKIVLVTNGAERLILEADKYAAAKDVFDATGWEFKQEREAKSWRVRRYVMTGAEVLNGEKGEAWPGIYIPIVPVYGDEVDVEGKRYFRSLIRDAKDAQRQFNYWRTTATELVALAPRVPYIGPKGAFKTDAAKWAKINSSNIPYVEYDGNLPPARQPLDTGAAAGALQEALNASDDMKAIMGLYDASLGQRSNETSGRAILARQREGDVSTFHFQDNMRRAIRHAGRILIDLIPKVYDNERMIRVMGEDGKPENIPLKQPVPVMDDQGQPAMEQGQDPATGAPVMRPQTRIYDLSAGKYDLTVSTGPSFTTRREEAANQMVAFIQAYPPAAPVIGDLLASNLDWPQADEIGERLKALLPPPIQGGPSPEMQKLAQEIQALQEENTTLKAKLNNKEGEIQVKGFEAETNRMEAATHHLEALKPDPVPLYEAQTRRYQAIKPEPPKGPTP